jgi:ABC-type glycerol-3-phosphate transport system substrate-binding protein
MKKVLMHRRVVSIAVLAAMVAALTACSSGGDSDASKVSILVVQNTNQVAVKDMAWAKQLAKDLRCPISWQTVDDTAWSQQKNTTLAAGQVPDIAIRAIQPSDAVQYPGVFADISKHLDKLPNVKAFFAEQPIAKKLAESGGGQILALTSSRGKSYAGSGQHMMINKAWLDKLGLGIPKTWDELTAVLEAFKTKDPNGNGKADEVPFNIPAIGTSGFSWFNPMLLLNSTGIVTQFNKGPSGQGIYVKDGKVSNFLVADHYKQVVEYLHQLMADGLVPKDALTQATSAYNATTTSDGVTARVGVVFGWSLADFGKLRDQYVAMPVPAASASMSPSDVVWDGSDNEFETGKLSVSAAAENKSCVWKIVNALYGQKYSI